MEPEFSIEFNVHGSPVTFQKKGPRAAKAKEDWKLLVADAARKVLPDEMPFATKRSLAVTLHYFPAQPMEGDLDNIIKLTLDAMEGPLYVNDHQIERVVIQKFEPGGVFTFPSASEVLATAMAGEKPVLFVRVSDDPYEDFEP